MAKIKIEGFNFAYNGQPDTLKNISLTVNDGDFVLLLGRSGSGKTTLLRSMVPAVASAGKKTGTTEINGKTAIVMQNPDSQAVMNTVWQELAFPLENMGVPVSEMNIRIAETAIFFSITHLFRREISTLSGGEKQTVILASAMLMNPDILILDEPTSQLDPVAAVDFLEAVAKINRELSVTVIITEHRLEEIFPIIDRVVLLENGEIAFDGDVQGFINSTDKNNPSFHALPTPVKIYMNNKTGTLPLSVRDGRKWLSENFCGIASLPTNKIGKKNETVLTAKNLHFMYEKDRIIINDLSLILKSGEIFCILGANGSGKTTLLHLLAGLFPPLHGKIKVYDKNIKNYKRGSLHGNIICALPQNPVMLFKYETAREELLESSEDYQSLAEEMGLPHVLDRHPYDLSGGEIQKLALSKILLKNPRIIFLDEPTKGLDPYFKIEFAKILKKLSKNGVLIVMATHDIEFAAENADHCAMLFDGRLTGTCTRREFFSNNNFYTTAASKMSRGKIKGAITCEDVNEFCKNAQSNFS